MNEYDEQDEMTKRLLDRVCEDVNVPTDGSASDVRLDDFLVNDLAINYKLDGYKVFLKVNNVFNEKYNTALQYSQMNRAFNFGIKRLF